MRLAMKLKPNLNLGHKFCHSVYVNPINIFDSATAAGGNQFYLQNNLYLFGWLSSWVVVSGPDPCVLVAAAFASPAWSILQQI